MGQSTKDDITLGEEKKTVNLKIPHAELGDINIIEDELEFDDVEHGLLGRGKITMTPEESKEIQKEARGKMNEKLEEQKSTEETDKFARMSVWEIYQPIINIVTTRYSLVVEIE